MLFQICLSDNILLNVETVYKKITEELLILEEKYRNYINLSCNNGVIIVYICMDEITPNFKNMKVKKNINFNHDIHFRVINSETMIDIFFSSGFFFYDFDYIMEDNKNRFYNFVYQKTKEQNEYTERFSNLEKREKYRKEQRELKRKDFFKKKEIIEETGFIKNIIKKIKDTIAIFKI